MKLEEEPFVRARPQAYRIIQNGSRGMLGSKALLLVIFSFRRIFSYSGRFVDFCHDNLGFVYRGKVPEHLESELSVQT